MIRIDAMWLAADPIDMRAGADRLLARVVQVLGAAQAHHGYLFANARGTRVKLLVHDGFGVWCAARRLNAGRFDWPGTTNATPLAVAHTCAVRCVGPGPAVAAPSRAERHHASLRPRHNQPSTR
jgi:transposase